METAATIAITASFLLAGLVDCLISSTDPLSAALAISLLQALTVKGHVKSFVFPDEPETLSPQHPAFLLAFFFNFAWQHKVLLVCH